MSLTKPQHGWERNAAKLLRLRILEGSPDKSVNYAPDAKYGAGPGPLTVQIDQILRRHAELWAQHMLERTGLTECIEMLDAKQGREAWLVEMREADAEIKRFLAGHKLTTGAAA